MTEPMPPVEHVTFVDKDGPGYRCYCRCGWKGRIRDPEDYHLQMGSWSGARARAEGLAIEDGEDHEVIAKADGML